MLANPRKQGIPKHPTRKRPIYKGFRGTFPETPYLRGIQTGYWEVLYPRELPGISLRAYGNNEAARNPLGAAAGAGRLGGSKGLIV